MHELKLTSVRPWTQHVGADGVDGHVWVWVAYQCGPPKS